MTKVSNLRWQHESSALGHDLYMLYGMSPFISPFISRTKHIAAYPFGSVSSIRDSIHHAYVRHAIGEPMQFMADFPTQHEAMDFVQLMVGSTDYD